MDLTSDFGRNYVIETSSGSALVILASGQGPQGPAGPAGGGVSTQTYTASATISAYTVVVIQNGQAVTADSSQASQAGNVVGVAIQGVNAGASVNVQFAGLLEYNGWNWTLGSEVVISSNGSLTQTPQTVGFNQVIGTPITPTSIFINMQSPIVI